MIITIGMIQIMLLPAKIVPLRKILVVVIANGIHQETSASIKQVKLNTSLL